MVSCKKLKQAGHPSELEIQKDGPGLRGIFAGKILIRKTNIQIKYRSEIRYDTPQKLPGQFFLKQKTLMIQDAEQ